MNGNYSAESKKVEIPVDQTGQNTKNELLLHQMSRIHHLQQAYQYWWNEAKVILLGVFLSTTESYMIITNILN